MVGGGRRREADPAAVATTMDPIEQFKVARSARIESYTRNPELQASASGFRGEIHRIW